MWWHGTIVVIVGKLNDLICCTTSTILFLKMSESTPNDSRAKKVVRKVGDNVHKEGNESQSEGIPIRMNPNQNQKESKSHTCVFYMILHEFILI